MPCNPQKCRTRLIPALTLWQRGCQGNDNIDQKYHIEKEIQGGNLHLTADARDTKSQAVRKCPSIIPQGQEHEHIPSLNIRIIRIPRFEYIPWFSLLIQAEIHTLQGLLLSTERLDLSIPIDKYGFSFNCWETIVIIRHHWSCSGSEHRSPPLALFKWSRHSKSNNSYKTNLKNATTHRYIAFCRWRAVTTGMGLLKHHHQIAGSPEQPGPQAVMVRRQATRRDRRRVTGMTWQARGLWPPGPGQSAIVAGPRRRLAESARGRVYEMSPKPIRAQRSAGAGTRQAQLSHPADIQPATLGLYAYHWQAFGFLLD
jgi:hypothetical protein